MGAKGVSGLQFVFFSFLFVYGICWFFSVFVCFRNIFPNSLPGIRGTVCQCNLFRKDFNTFLLLTKSVRGVWTKVASVVPAFLGNNPFAYQARGFLVLSVVTLKPTDQKTNLQKPSSFVSGFARN